MTESCERVRDLAAGFVLGALTADEERDVRDHLATCPLPHAELAELGGVVPYLAETVELVEPPPSLKDRVLAAAAADLAGPRLASRAAGPAATAPREPTRPSGPTPFPTSAERAVRIDRSGRGRSPLAWVAAVAAVLLVVAVGTWNVSLQRELDVARQYERGLSAVLDVAATPGSQTAILSGEGGTDPTGLAAVAADGRVAIVMRDLAALSGSEVYEAWVIGGEGTPVPLGGLHVAADGTATFSTSGAPVESGVVVALTREPAPGATAPTGPIVSAGKATSAGS